MVAVRQASRAPGPELVPLVLTGGERGSLEVLARKRTASQSLVLRARIVLACADQQPGKLTSAGRTAVTDGS